MEDQKIQNQVVYRAISTDESQGIKQAKVDPATNRVLAGHAKDGKILSFYIALPKFVVEDPFTDAVNYALEKTKLSKSEVKYKC
ncbi:hypothetical protein [Lysinibacillus xylanilyticus]|uniref:hypothetical protein n=1 Tax=Lysinibacillus xylanilyticus TaxID=582475 RepID=UPI003D0459BA